MFGGIEKNRTRDEICHLVEIRLLSFRVIEVFDLSSARLRLLPLGYASFFVPSFALRSFVAKHLDLSVGAMKRDSTIRVCGVGVDLKVQGHTLEERGKKG